LCAPPLVTGEKNKLPTLSQTWDMSCTRRTWVEGSIFGIWQYTQLVKKFPVFYGSRMFITVFAKFCHRSWSWSKWIPSTPPKPISSKSILIFYSHLDRPFLRGLLPSYFPTKIFYAFLVFPMHHVILHLILFDLIALIFA
jgi:hypothetical protein